MEPFEYVVVLTSLILGLGLSQILIGVSNSLADRSKIKVSLPHSLMVLVIFVLHVQEWWIDYQYSKTIEAWTLPMVLSLLIYPILLFLYARMLFPYQHEHDQGQLSLEKYYFEKWQLFFIIGVSMVLVSIWQNYVISDISLPDQWLLLIYAGTYVIFLGLKITDRRVHIGFWGLQLLVLIIYVATDATTL